MFNGQFGVRVWLSRSRLVVMVNGHWSFQKLPPSSERTNRTKVLLSKYRIISRKSSHINSPNKKWLISERTHLLSSCKLQPVTQRSLSVCIVYSVYPFGAPFLSVREHAFLWWMKNRPVSTHTDQKYDLQIPFNTLAKRFARSTGQTHTHNVRPSRTVHDGGQKNSKIIIIF